jgi:hypothetical protein
MPTALVHNLSNAIIESVNAKIRLLTRVASGFRSHALSPSRCSASAAWCPEYPAELDRTHRYAWGNQYGKLRWCTERRRLAVKFWLALANAAIVCGRLICRAWTCYRWEGRPRRRP